MLLHELVLSETLCFSFFFFFNLSVYKELVIDCNFYILKLNLISFFGTVIIPTLTKNKLMIILKIWNLWAIHLLYLYMYPNNFVSEAYWHLELVDLEASWKSSSCKYIKIFRASAERSNISSVLDEIAGCVLEGCNFVKCWFTIWNIWNIEIFFKTASYRYISKNILSWSLFIVE